MFWAIYHYITILSFVAGSLITIQITPWPPSSTSLNRGTKILEPNMVTLQLKHLPDITSPLDNGKLKVEVWQQVYVFDNQSGSFWQIPNVAELNLFSLPNRYQFTSSYGLIGFSSLSELSVFRIRFVWHAYSMWFCLYCITLFLWYHPARCPN